MASHRTTSPLASFTQARDDIARAPLTRERFEGEWRAFVESLRARASIEWRDEGLQRAYERVIADLAPADQR